MLTEDFLKEALREDFDSFITIKGKKLYHSDAVYHIKLSEGTLDAIVIEQGVPYSVQFEKSEDDRYIFFDGHCTCGEPECEHQAAALYAAIDAVQSARPARGRRGRRPKQVVQAQLEGKHAGLYRSFPLEMGLLNAVQQFRAKRYQDLNWSESIEGTLISPTEIELTSTTNDSYYFVPISKKMHLKVENGKMHVKCFTCKSNKKTFCEHQTALLAAAVKELHHFDFSNPEAAYKQHINRSAEQLKVNPEIVEKYFHLKILPSGIALAPKQSNMVNERWLQLMHNISNYAKDERQKLIEQETERLEEGRGLRYAFVWTNRQDYDKSDQPALSFVKGPGYKTKEGVKDLVKHLEDLPNNFPEQLQNLGQRLFFHLREENTEKQFHQIKALLKEHIEALNNIYQYTYVNGPYGHAPRVSELNMVKFSPSPLACRISFEVIDGFIHLTRHISHQDTAFDFNKVVYSNTVFCSTKNRAYLYPHHKFLEFMSIFPEGHDTIILPNVDEVQKTTLVNQFRSHFEVTVPSQFSMEEEILTDAHLQILLREAGNFVLFEPRLQYQEHSFNAFEEDTYFIEDKLYRINEEDREFLLRFLKNAHPAFNNPVQVQDYVYLDLNEMVNNYWFIRFNEACEAAGIEVLGQKELSKFNYSKHRAKTYMHIKSGIDWFDVEAGLSFGKEKIKTADWIRALRNKETFVRLKDGSLGILPEEWLKQASKLLAVADVDKGQLKISKYRFNIIEELFDNIDDKQVLKELKEKKARLQAIDLKKRYRLPKNVKAKLRNYQKHGFTWLKFLDESGFGGILADDMGLGKTLQVITLLAEQIDRPTSLVIVPRSLLFNWAAELDKFCPDLKYQIHHGPGRAKNMERLQLENIIITTYHTVTNDIQIFKDFKFNYIILDESQAIKNPDAKRYKAIRLLQSRNKLAMTGTPIENNTFDLYSQLSFTSPGLLGGRTNFKNNFSVPIDSNGDAEAAELLRKLTHPFILRRTKEQVAKDLPEKTETIIYCEMGTAQRKLYEKLKKGIREDIQEAVEEKGVNKSKFQILDGLLRLRQMCNSPLLVNPSFSGVNADSVKINTLMESLVEALDQKHHALVFSQFVSLLTIVRKELDQRGIRYAYLDGSTTKRQAEVDKFMNNDEIKIFLISIKAGNTGMNLTKADYVYILDPWWNPAVEAQAIDRTHRIGQKNQIFAYKLICKNSIEEKILQLQAKKKKLASEIIRTDENILKSLKKEDLMALFD
ncbi:MAG: DEAD/DEAH box helicase [Bacteroidota bacterium]